MRLKRFTFIRLDRRVAHTAARCAWCGWLSAPLDSVYTPRIGGRALGWYCSARCAQYGVRVPMQVSYTEAA